MYFWKMYLNMCIKWSIQFGWIIVQTQIWKLNQYFINILKNSFTKIDVE